MGYLFTSESVSEGHTDKVADQISDAVLDKLLAFDPSSKVACETLVTTGQVVLAGEVKTKAYVDLQRIAGTEKPLPVKLRHLQDPLQADSSPAAQAVHKQKQES